MKYTYISIVNKMNVYRVDFVMCSFQIRVEVRQMAYKNFMRTEKKIDSTLGESSEKIMIYELNEAWRPSLRVGYAFYAYNIKC